MVQKIGERHHFRARNADAKLRGNGLVVSQREESETAQAEMAVGGGQADVTLRKVFRRFRHGEKLNEPILRAGRLESRHGELGIRRFCGAGRGNSSVG